MEERLAQGAAVWATLPGLRGDRRKGIVSTVKPKGYGVTLDGETKERHFTEKKVAPRADRDPKPANVSEAIEFAPASDRQPMPAGLPAKLGGMVCYASQLAEVRAQPKPEAPERSPAYLEFVRGEPCCNCQAKPRSDPHHEGKKGVGQKVRDTRTVPLCRTCHRTYTDTNCLPQVVAPGVVGHELREREESWLLLHTAMRRLQVQVLRRLPLEVCCEVLSAALARMDQAELRRALRPNEEPHGPE